MGKLCNFLSPKNDKICRLLVSRAFEWLNHENVIKINHYNMDCYKIFIFSLPLASGLQNILGKTDSVGFHSLSFYKRAVKFY